MRICFFNRSYDPDKTATGQLLTELAEDLTQKHGCEVSVVTGRVSGLPDGDRPSAGLSKSPRYECIRGVRVYRAWGTTFSKSRLLGRIANYITYFLASCLLAWRVPALDIAVAFTDPPFIGLAAWFASIRRKARFVLVCQDVYPEAAQVLLEEPNKIAMSILGLISRFLVKKADRVVAVGSTMRSRLISKKGAEPSKTLIIHNWADCAAIFPTPKRNEFSTLQGLVHRFVVMHSGNVGLSQELDVLIEAAALLRDLRDLVVVIIGDGVKRPSLEAKAKALGLSNVRFLPFQSKESLRFSFAAADLFILSLKRGLAGYIVPTKLFGILAAGRPYVAAVEEESEVASITREYDSGLLAHPGDVTELADRIRQLYRDRQRLNLLGENARRAALKFDRGCQVEAYFQLFQALETTSQQGATSTRSV